jgi:hypothetical protein
MAGEPNAQDAAEQQEAHRRLAAYAQFFNSESGRLVLQCLRESLDGNTFRNDPYEAAYYAGRRSVYLNILQGIGQGELVLAALDASKARQAGVQAARAEMPATIEDL